MTWCFLQGQNARNLVFGVGYVNLVRNFRGILSVDWASSPVYSGRFSSLEPPKKYESAKSSQGTPTSLHSGQIKVMLTAAKFSANWIKLCFFKDFGKVLHSQLFMLMFRYVWAHHTGSPERWQHLFGFRPVLGAVLASAASAGFTSGGAALSRQGSTAIGSQEPYCSFPWSRKARPAKLLPWMASNPMNIFGPIISFSQCVFSY